ncbi:hypothetical protein NA56DRAFT_647077 [Hyaloscypha hepaticicola]|uniref:Uncharacterized protein n=1 Tax=Hyaloscypha hepaticicola TaxID=2082293 RepID=A0A2J6Q0S0_9HELO|nr:hypothetical protein NA56DRAFT_647077 [Hyaloscypha hepaticicola]
MHHHAPLLALCTLLSLVSSGPAATSAIPTAMADNEPMPTSTTAPTPFIFPPYDPSISTPSNATPKTTPTPSSTSTPSLLPTAVPGPDIPGMNISTSISILTSTTNIPPMSMTMSMNTTTPVIGAASGERVRLRSVRGLSLVFSVVVVGMVVFA